MAATGERSIRNPEGPIVRDHYDAVLFDLEGVITDTADLHAACWKHGWRAVTGGGLVIPRISTRFPIRRRDRS